MTDLLSVTTSAIRSTKSLYGTVKRYKGRDKTLARLQDEIEGLTNVLVSLKEAIDSDGSISEILTGPVERCRQVCHDFERVMERFGGKSKTGLRDWAKMEFMSDDINGFMDALASYKSTILVCLGTVTMHHSKISHQILDDYNEMIQTTAYSLEVRLQRIEAYISGSNAASSDTNVDLQDEKGVIKQCLRICQDAQSHIESLQDRQSSSLPQATSETADMARNLFDVELMTSQTLSESRQKFTQTITQLQERLISITSNSTPDRDHQIAQLREDINISKQCLDLCKEASDQVAYRKIHTIGEVIADDNTDQVVVTTMADLFDVRKVLAKSSSAQLVGSMSATALQQLSTDRYNSRFGAVNGNVGYSQVNIATAPADLEVREVSTRPANPAKKNRQSARAEIIYDRPIPNEVRKRDAGD